MEKKEALYGKWKNIAYIIFSTVKENEARQKESLKNYNIDKRFIEKASGKNANRPILQELLEYIRENDTVYVEEFSRLGSPPLIFWQLCNKLRILGLNMCH